MQIYRRLRRAGWRPVGLMLLVSCGAGGFAAAAEPPAVTTATPHTTENIQVIADPRSAREDIAGIGRPIDADALGELRGGDSSVENDIRVDGEVIGNSAEHIVSGANTIDGSAFGNAAGLSTVIQNSGSNVLIQNAMIVNVQFGSPDL